MTDHAELIGPLLREVSRSFYLTLRVLPAQIRPQISVAYLLARASDTIADTEAVAKPERVALLRGLVAGQIPGSLSVAEAVPSEAKLLECLPEVLKYLDAFPTEDQQRIRQLLETIIGGQIFDLERFPGNALSADELDRYTYMVAGCVGEFWTKMCRAHLPGMESLDIECGVRFGKGLQLVNILRDMPKDLRIGRCYLPGGDAQALLGPNNFTTIEHTYRHWLDVAAEHLDAGWQYTLSIPANQKRLRLACIWPIWIGVKTIARLQRANPLDPARRVKVSRAEVYWMMLESALLVGNDAALDEVYRRLRAATSSARP
jgi:farnesyl-diphosphate farnesyltransferase